MNTFHGDASEPAARIWPVKRFRGKQPYDLEYLTLLVPPHRHAGRHRAVVQLRLGPRAGRRNGRRRPALQRQVRLRRNGDAVAHHPHGGAWGTGAGLRRVPQPPTVA